MSEPPEGDSAMGAVWVMADGYRTTTPTAPTRPDSTLHAYLFVPKVQTLKGIFITKSLICQALITQPDRHINNRHSMDTPCHPSVAADGQLRQVAGP